MGSLNKKTKRASVSFGQFNDVDDESKSRLKYQTLLEEHLELQKEFVSRKKKLEAAKEKRKTILAEVRFLRRRRRYLSRTRVPESDVEGAPQNLDKVRDAVAKNKEAVGNVQVHEDDLKLNKKLKSRLIARSVGKREISWPDKGCLKV